MEERYYDKVSSRQKKDVDKIRKEVHDLQGWVHLFNKGVRGAFRKIMLLGN